jgi:hypothetical protein
VSRSAHAAPEGEGEELDLLCFEVGEEGDGW